MTLRIGVLARTILLHSIEPPIRNVLTQRLCGAVREVVNRAAVLPVVREPAAVVRCVFQALLDDARVLPVYSREAEVLVRATEVPLADHVALVARRVEGLRHHVLAEIKATLIVRAVPDRVSTGHQTGARHAANRSGIETLQTDRSRHCRAEGVHVRRLNRHLTRSSVVADIRPALVIRDDDHDVRRRFHRESEGLCCRVTHAVRRGGGEVGRACGSRCSTEGAIRSKREPWRQRAAGDAPSVRPRAARRRESLCVRRTGERTGKRRSCGDRERERRGVTTCARKSRYHAGAIRGGDGEADAAATCKSGQLRSIHTIASGTVSMQPVIEHRDCCWRISGNRFHHDVINVSLRSGRSPHPVSNELETQLEVARELRPEQVVVIQLKHTVRRAREIAGARVPCGAAVWRDLQDPSKPCRHRRIASIEFHIAGEARCVDCIRCRHHRLRGGGRSFAELKPALIALACGRVVSGSELSDIPRTCLGRDGPVVNTHSIPRVCDSRARGHGLIEDRVRRLRTDVVSELHLRDRASRDGSDLRRHIGRIGIRRRCRADGDACDHSDAASKIHVKGCTHCRVAAGNVERR